MKISVIIPTYKRNDLLAKCLERLKPQSQTLAPELYEVIVTDDSPYFDAKNLIEEFFPWAQWVEGPHRGPAANRNSGISHSKNDWIVLTDDDCIPESNWLESYYTNITSHPSVYVYEGAVHPTSWDDLRKDLADCPINVTGGYFWTANVAFKKDLFLKIGGFNETFLIAAQEDQQLKIDFEKYSSIIFIQDSIVKHPIRILSLKNEIEKLKPKSINYTKFYYNNNKNQSLSQFYLHTILFHFKTLISSTKTPKKYKQLTLRLIELIYLTNLNAWHFYKIKQQDNL